MVSHTREDIDEINNRRLVALFTAMHVAAKNANTTHEKVLANLAFWRSLPRIDRSMLFELMRDQISPALPTSPVATTAGEQGRSAIGGNLPTESRPT
jgi:hypothetical protein